MEKFSVFIKGNENKSIKYAILVHVIFALLKFLNYL